MNAELSHRLETGLSSSGVEIESGARIEDAFCSAVIDRVVRGADGWKILAILRAAYSESNVEMKNEIACGLTPSLQIACFHRTSDLETYRGYRNQIVPYLPGPLQEVWRNWERQLPFGAGELLEPIKSREEEAEPSATDNPDDAQRLREDH